MWLFFLGWIAGVISCIGFGKWASGRKIEKTETSFKMSEENVKALIEWVKEHDERSERDS